MTKLLYVLMALNLILILLSHVHVTKTTYLVVETVVQDPHYHDLACWK